MPRAENLTITGKCFLPINIEKDTIPKLKSNITRFMYKSDYLRSDIVHPLLDDSFLSLKFLQDYRNTAPPFKLKLLKQLKLITQNKYNSELYEIFLKTVTDDTPLEVNFIITPSKRNKNEGMIIEIRSKPIILFKIKQMEVNFPYDEFKYSKILDTNKEYIYEIMKALNAKIIDKPEVISDYNREIYKTPIIDELEKYGYVNVSKIIKEGLVKLNNGKVKDAFDELRSALEIITKEMADRHTNKSYPQDKVKNNLNILKNENIIDEKMCAFLVNVYYKGLYSYLSDNVTHKRKDIAIRDGEFLYGLIENYITFLIKKAIL